MTVVLKKPSYWSDSLVDKYKNDIQTAVNDASNKTFADVKDH